MAKGKVLVLGSNATQIEVQGGYGPTGQYLNETVVPVMALIAAGYEVVLATPKGTKPTIDAASDAPAHFENDVVAYERAKAFYAKDPSMNQALRDAGGEVVVTDVDFAPNVVIDRELITGQNPRSDHPIAQALVAALDRATA